MQNSLLYGLFKILKSLNTLNNQAVWISFILLIII